MPLAPALRGQLIRAETDATLLGDDKNEEPIHSVLLMTLSPYFHTILDTNGTGRPIRIEGADEEILAIIKEYAYEGKISGLSEKNVDQLHRVADMYNIISIINECQLFIDNTRNSDSESNNNKR